MAAVTLGDLYRRIRAGEVEVATVREPEPDVPSLGIYFGCRPWARDSEAGPVDRVMAHPVTAEPVVVAVCDVCGSGLEGDPLGRTMTCGGCLRSVHDGKIVEILAKYPPPKHGELGPMELAEQSAARKPRPKAGTDAYLYRQPG